MILRTMPADGTRRIIKRFCWYPRTVGGVTYWFETIRIKQQFNNYGTTGWWKSEGIVRL